MGQFITVSSQVVGDVAVFDTDRSVTGQDGEAFSSAEAAAEASGLPADMAGRIFAADPSVQHAFVLSNGVSVSRDGGWDDAAVASVADVIERFFVFYRDGESRESPAE